MDGDNFTEEELSRFVNGIMKDQDRRNERYARAKHRKIYSNVPESKRTLFFYMLNLLCMILMCVFIFGVAIIFFFLLVEGSSRLKQSVLVHSVVPALALLLNLYVVTMDEKAEFKFFSKGQGQFVMNVVFVLSTLALFITLLLKVMQEKPQGQADESYEAIPETALAVEEYVIHTLAIIQSYSLKEYAESRLHDIETYKEEEDPVDKED